MLKTSIAGILLATATSCATGGIPSPDALPNIILIMADDMGYECLSCNGSTSYSTPELDKLADNGIRFTNCHAQPLCTPSRVKIMTGRYNCYNYIDFGYLDVNEKTFGNVLQEAGYRTMIAGKWQLNGVDTHEQGCMDQRRPYEFGFDEYCLWWLTEKGSRYAQPKIVRNEQLIETSLDDYGPDIVSDHILDFIKQCRGEPFFVYYPMMLVHSPFKPTPDSRQWDNLLKRNMADTKYFKDMVAYTDKIIGKIAARLDELNLSDNTIIIFTGDNGTNKDIISQTMDGPYPGGKGRLKDNGTHVPLVISWPGGGLKNVTSDALVDFSDFLPTLADAAGADLPGNIDGKSFFDLLAGRPYLERSSIFVHYYPNTTQVSSRNGCFARTAAYKLYSDGRFYDMTADKWENNPLDTGGLNNEQKEIYMQLENEFKSKPVWDFTTIHGNQ